MTRTIAGLAVGVALLLACPAQAELRFLVYDDALVEQAEVIAVGYLRPETIELVPHLRKDEADSWEYHVVLVVDHYLKGRRDEVEIPIVLEYGFEARVGEIWREGFSRLGPAEREALRGQAVEIQAADWLWPLVPDASQRHLWFLRTVKHDWLARRQPSTGRLGVRDPEALQRLELLSYFQAYLAPDPEAAVAEQARRDPAVAERAQGYLEHRRIQRILALPDPQERVAALLPFYQQPPGRSQFEARRGILAAGAAAGPLLVPVFDSRPDLRADIIRLWRESGYREAPDLPARQEKEQ